MPSPYRDRVYFLLMDIRSIFISEFSLLTPFMYEDVQPKERYGMFSFEEWDSDINLQATDVFKVIRGDIVLCFGYGSLLEAETSPIQVMTDLDNFRGVLFQELTSNFDIFYDFEIQGTISRALRQPIRNPDVWVSDVTCSALIKIAVPKTSTGLHKF